MQSNLQEAMMSFRDNMPEPFEAEAVMQPAVEQQIVEPELVPEVPVAIPSAAEVRRQ